MSATSSCWTTQLNAVTHGAGPGQHQRTLSLEGHATHQEECAANERQSTEVAALEPYSGQPRPTVKPRNTVTDMHPQLLLLPPLQQLLQLCLHSLQLPLQPSDLSTLRCHDLLLC